MNFAIVMIEGVAMTMLLLQGLLGLGFMGFGVYRFLNLDAAREKRSRTKPAQRIEAWERGYVTSSGIAVLIGIFFMVVSFASAFAPQPPVGEYICLPTTTSSEGENTFLVLQRDGTGTYDGRVLTWTSVNDTPLQIIFNSQGDLVAGEFPIKDDPKSFVVTQSDGETQLCLLR